MPTGETNYLDCGDDYLNCGDDYLNCGDDYLNCGDDYLNCGDDEIVAPPIDVNSPEPINVGPYDQGPPREDNWFIELVYKIIVWINDFFAGIFKR